LIASPETYEHWFNLAQSNSILAGSTCFPEHSHTLCVASSSTTISSTTWVDIAVGWNDGEFDLFGVKAART
jgi:hypothetical protein